MNQNHNAVNIVQVAYTRLEVVRTDTMIQWRSQEFATEGV